MPETEKRNWHTAFYAAIQIELEEYKNVLEFRDEFQLTTDPQKIDVLVIKKEPDVKIDKNIGRIFKGHNIIEYKSVSDYLSENDFYKTYAYAMNYKQLENVDITDITITFIETRHPRNLLKHIKEVRENDIKEVDSGIYYIEGDYIPIQIIESKKLSDEENLWLKNLSNDIQNEATVRKIFENYKTNVSDKNYDIFMRTLWEENYKIFTEVSDMAALTMKDGLTEVFQRHGWIEEIEQKKAIEVARKMLNMKMTPEQIQNATDLSIEKIQLLQTQ